MFKTLFILLIVGIAGFLAYAATRPDDFAIQRTTEIKAPPETIFPFINDLHKNALWSPFEKMDPAMQRSHSGTAAGRGAVYEWEGNDKAGKGRIEIIKSVPYASVTMQLDMIKPMAARNTVEFSLQPNGNMTEVTWKMHGVQPFLGKVMSIFIDCDAMVGKEFETGLANLKTVAENRVASGF